MSHRGFTLIELMIVLAILGILAIIAIPMYQDYMIRSRISEGLQVCAAAKTAVADTFQSVARYPVNNQEAGLPPLISTSMVDSIEVKDNGIIEITYNSTNVGVQPGENVITLVPNAANGAMSWNCTGGTVLARYRPSSCRINP